MFSTQHLGVKAQHSKSAQAGFSLIELMVVVLIIGILATMGTYGYGKWIGRARRAEAVGILAEMSAKEILYFGDFGAYLPLRGDNTRVQNENDTGFYPIAPNNPAFESKRSSTSIANPAGWPADWRAIGIRPRRNELYCTYILNTGAGNTAVPAALTYGVRIMGAAVIPIPWFYALAACNFDGVGGLPDEVNVFGVTHNSPLIREWNENK